MKLYELNGYVKQLAEMLEEGEIDDTIYADTLEALMAENAVEDVVKAIRNAEADVVAYKEEIQQLTAKKQRAEKSIDCFKKLILDFCNTTQQKKITAGIFKVSRGVSKSTEIVDISQIPPKYLVQQSPTVDKKSLLKDLKEGEEIQGAKIKETEYITIR